MKVSVINTTEEEEVAPTDVVEVNSGVSDPEWVKNQQKETQSQDSEERKAKREKTKYIKIRMKTSYRNEVKAGEIYIVDKEKADELVKLRRAEYI